MCEFRACLKDLDILRAPFSNEELEAFYNRHRECKTGKVTSPRAKSFFASIFANKYEEERQKRRNEMIITLEEDEEEQEEVEEDEGNNGESEQEEERGETEGELAVASIMPEVMAPSLGDEFNWDEVEAWMRKETEARQPTSTNVSQVNEAPCPQPTIEDSTPHTFTTQPQILTSGYTAQTHTIIKLKDSLSREEKCREDCMRQLEQLKRKLQNYENRFERLRRQEEDRAKEEDALNRARNVINTQMADVERREKAVKEIDQKIQKEKKEMWQDRSKLEVEKEELRKEREQMEAEREMMKAEREKVTEREEDIKVKGRRLKALFEDIKKEKTKENEVTRSLLHIPIKNGEIAGDPYIQKIPCKTQECFQHDVVCGHVKIRHVDTLKLSSWNNKISRRSLTTTNFDSNSDSSDDFEMPPTKKMKNI